MIMYRVILKLNINISNIARLSSLNARIPTLPRVKRIEQSDILIYRLNSYWKESVLITTHYLERI